MKLIKLLLASVCLMFAATAAADDPGPLKSTTEYWFVGHLGQFDDQGRLLAWEGIVSGDIDGMIRWWMVVPVSITGQVTHFAERWEILDITGTVVYLEGYNAGTTTNRPGKSGVWRSNGVVTWVNPGMPELAQWYGRHMHESGEFYWLFPGGPPSDGTGIFRVN